MPVSEIITKNKKEIESLCRKYHVKIFELIGSAAKDTFNDYTSDLDFLVDFDPALPATQKAEAFFGLKEDLEVMFSRSVDLVTVSSLTNPYFRASVLEERHSLYAA